MLYKNLLNNIYIGGVVGEPWFPTLSLHLTQIVIREYILLERW
jgi:hypothetical protein